jgi:SAM-dependent methyltransferase
VTDAGRLAFFRATPDAAFWSAHWSRESLDHLLAVAEASPLTRFVERHVRPGDRVLEGGCGLGQYVLYFGRRGVRITGVDFSDEAVAVHRALHPTSDMRVADLAELPFDAGEFDAYVSLGVVEHYRDGGAAILREARRLLKPSGRLILSVPYLNLSRRLLRRRIERREGSLAARGGEFYQYAFTERALDDLLRDAGFLVIDRSYYDVGRGVRDTRSLLARRRAPHEPVHRRTRRPQQRGAAKAALLYAAPTLRTFAHMQIVAATPLLPLA